MKDYTLTCEITSDGDEVEIHATKEGLISLKKEIEYLIQNENDHVHLRTPIWGGSELTEENQGQGSKIVNHVKIFSWKEE